MDKVRIMLSNDFIRMYELGTQFVQYIAKN